MGDTGTLIYETADAVAMIVLNRPEKLNAFDDEMIQGLVAALERARADDTVRAIVITGAGRGFCSGADTGKMGSDVDFTPVSVARRLRSGLQRIPLTLSAIDKPVIAAVNGVAAGAGMDLALMCDIRFAAASARLGETYTRLGLVPGAGGAYFLPRVVGVAKALELFWDGEFVESEDALRIGLVNRVYPDEELMEQTYVFARKLAASPPLAVTLVKRAIYQGLSADLSANLDLIASYLGIARTSRDCAEAIAAYREKRPGRYEGK